MNTPPPKTSLAFTFTELLVVVFTAVLLFLLPCFAGTRERLNRVVCLNNLRQMGTGSQMYAAEDPQGRLSGGLPAFAGDRPDDDLNWLYGYGPSRTKYLQDIKTVLCPATRNVIRTNTFFHALTGYTLLTDLYDNGSTPTGYGHSYEVLSTWSTTNKTLNTIFSFRKTQAPQAGSYPGPSMILLMFDALDTYQGLGRNDYPNAYAGHGTEGGNIVFCDGHAEWVDTKDWTYRFAISQDYVQP